MMKRLFMLGLMAALLAFSALALPAINTSTAHAATVTPHTDTSHCASLGTLIETHKLTADGITLGYLNVYYNSSNGYNCAETTSSSTTYGQKKLMGVGLAVCTQTSPGNTCNFISRSKPYYDVDEDNYSYYAGPVGVNGKGHCITIAGEITWNGHHNLYQPLTAVHCG